ncbi:glycosyl transferase family 1, partial [Actinomyces naeslundii]
MSMVVEQLWQPVPGGSGTYIVELSRALRARQVPVAGITARHQAAPSPREMGLPPMPMRSSHLPRAALYESWNRLGLPRAESILPGAQLIHATTWALPPTSLPLAVTVHDLAFLRTPEHFTPRGNAYFSRSLERVIAEASAIIVPSQATADDCIAAGIDAARLYVI